MAKVRTEPQTEQPDYFPDFDDNFDPSKVRLREEMVSIRRVAKVVKGGRRFSFSALVVVGDENGHVGVGFGKANEVPSAIAKAFENGKKNIITVPLIGRTIPHPIIGKFGAAEVLLKPASEGTGIIAGPAVRAVVELAGIGDVLTKSLGSSNVLNVLKATIQGLASLKSPEHVARIRERSIDDVLGKKRADDVRSTYREMAGVTEESESKAEVNDDAEEKAPETQIELAEETPPPVEAKKPAPEKPAAKEPAAKEPAAKELAANEPEVEKPAEEKPAAKKPADEKKEEAAPQPAADAPAEAKNDEDEKSGDQ